MSQSDPCVLVVFGATGDLSRRMLAPALETLVAKKMVPEPFLVLGTGRSDMTDEAFRDMMGKALGKHGGAYGSDVRDTFLGLCHYAGHDSMAARLKELWASASMPANALFYMALPPKAYEPTVSQLCRDGLNRSEDGWRRVVVEKPFGFDLASAKQMNRTLLDAFDENDVYRIDHYLGKETVQNIMALRFGNGIFEPLWNAHHIHHVEITAAENLGLGGRAQYFDGIGIIRDMVQNHLLQVLATVAMEPPVRFDADAVRNETAKVFSALRPLSPEDVEKSVVRAQYAGAEIKGVQVPGYREEEGVDPQSRTETYAALKIHVDSWRWAGVPFYIRTGKRLPTKVTEVVIRFRDPPRQFFRNRAEAKGAPNQLVLRIQPDEGVLLSFGIKTPGEGFRLENAAMDFHYADRAERSLPSAYERLLSDAMNGDATLFARTDAVENCWAYVDPIFNAWDNDPDMPLYSYPAGSWGPPQVTGQLFEPGFDFRYPCRALTADDGICLL